jgi:hypothetical protein
MKRFLTALPCLVALAGTAWAVEIPDTVPVRSSAERTTYELSAACRATCRPPPATCCDPCVRCPQWHAGLYGWFSWLDGETEVLGSDVDFDATPSELLENLEGLFIGSLGVRWDRWNVEALGLYTKLGTDVAGPSGQAGDLERVELTQWVAQATVGYAVASWAVGSCPNSCLTLIPEAGLRYVSLDLDFEFSRDHTNKSVDWLDPIVGGKLLWDTGSRWSFLLGANVGGFGVGSDFTAEVRLVAEYRLASWIGLTAGFEALYWDYDDEIAMEQWTYGPFLGVEFHW